MQSTQRDLPFEVDPLSREFFGRRFFFSHVLARLDVWIQESSEILLRIGVCFWYYSLRGVIPKSVKTSLSNSDLAAS